MPSQGPVSGNEVKKPCASREEILALEEFAGAELALDVMSLTRLIDSVAGVFPRIDSSHLPAFADPQL
jgi:hypothetical protein